MRGPVTTLLALLLLGAGAGCGSSTAEPVPALTARLERVDAAAVAGDRQTLVTAVEGLLRAVDEAEDSGDINGTHAEEIRAAAARLLDAVDSREPSPSPSAPEASTSPPAPPPDSDDEDEEEDEEDEESGWDEGHGHGKSKGKSKGHGKSDH